MSPFQTLKFPTGTVAKVLQLRLTFQKDTYTLGAAAGRLGPELYSFRVRGQLRPDASPIYSVKLYVADEVLLLNGATASTRKGDLGQLRVWNDTASEILLTLPEDDAFV